MKIKTLTGTSLALAIFAGASLAGTLDTETTFEEPIAVEEQSRGSGLAGILIPALIIGGVAAAVLLTSDDGT